MAKLVVGDKEYDFNMDNITNSEGIAIEKVMGTTFGRWSESLTEGSMLAMTALVWLFQRRENPQLRFDDVQFEIGAMKIVEDENDSQPNSQRTELIPGERTAVMDPKDLTSASEVSTTDETSI